MNTLLEPPSSIFHPKPCINSYVIKRRSRFLRPLNLDIPSLGFSTLTFPKTNGVTPQSFTSLHSLGEVFLSCYFCPQHTFHSFEQEYACSCKSFVHPNSSRD